MRGLAAADVIGFQTERDLQSFKDYVKQEAGGTIGSNGTINCFDRTLEGFVLVDLRSRNGSFVNGKRVDAVVLRNGDEVRLGTARLRYKMD